MADITHLKEHLIQSGRLTEEQFLQAEDYANTRKMTVETALLFLNCIDDASLGGALSEISGLPYAPVLHSPPPPSAKAKVPQAMAERWKVFPVSYDPQRRVLGVASESACGENGRRHLRTLFSPDMDLRFFACSSHEIEEAIAVYYRGKARRPERELEIPEDFTVLISQHGNRGGTLLERAETSDRKVLVLEPDFDRARAIKTILRSEGYPDVEWAATPQAAATLLRECPRDLLLANGQSFDSRGFWLRDIPQERRPPSVSYYHTGGLFLGQGYAYEQMSEAIASMTGFLVERAVRGDPVRMQRIRAKVRLCRLLAMRLKLTRVQVDAVVLAAWLSSVGVGKDLLKRVKLPYPIEEILEGGRGEDRGTESWILNLVGGYLELREGDSAAANDVSRLRRELGGRNGSTERNRVLEVFLHLIRDEEFLQGVDTATRRILMVDPGQGRDAPEVLRLINDGYEVVSARDARSAVEAVHRSEVDLVISEADLPDVDGLRLCRALKEKPRTSHLGFFFLTSKDAEGFQARCLSAGADDFLAKPVDLDVLALKVQRFLAAGRTRESKGGIRGSLEEMNAVDFIQSLTAGEKDTEITIRGPGGEGRIFIQAGDVVHAETADLRGEEALYRMLSWEEGEFRIVRCEQFPPRTIFAATMSLMMEGARLIDESREPPGGLS